MNKYTLFILSLLFLLFTAASACAKNQYITMGYGYVIAVQADGTVEALDETCDTSAWKDVIQVDGSLYHTLGLSRDGTVYAMGNNRYGQCNVEKWTDIVMVAAGDERSYGLKKDGTIVSAGRRDTGKRSAWKKWTGIVWIDVTEDTLFAIDREGNAYGIGVDLSMFHDVVQIYHTTDEINVLRKDGTVHYLHKYDGYEEAWQQYKDKWTDIRELDGISSELKVLKGDGRVTTTSLIPCFADWRDIVEIAGYFGVKSDGTIVISSFYDDVYTPEEMAELASWRVMVDPETIPDAAKTDTP